jgi:hypothetical protein
MAAAAELVAAAEDEAGFWAPSAARKMTMDTIGKTIRKTTDLFICN